MMRRQKDIIICERFTFAPNFRKALALHYGRPTVTNDEIRAWIKLCVGAIEREVEDKYYDSLPKTECPS